MRMRRGFNVWTVLAASGVLWRLLTRDRPSRPPIDRSHGMLGRPAAEQPAVDARQDPSSLDASQLVPASEPTPASAATPVSGASPSSEASPTSGPLPIAEAKPALEAAPASQPIPAPRPDDPASGPASDETRPLADLSRPELYRLARSRGLRHTVVMTKAELIEALSRFHG
jgi:hypothetical protein